MTIQSKVNWLIGLVVVLIVLVVWLIFARVQPIHRYLGSAEGSNAAAWTGLRGNLKQNTQDLRKVLNDMNCRIWMLGEYPLLKHPYDTQPRPTPCPPGPPGTVPKDPP
jgi:hypothetical protein